MASYAHPDTWRLVLRPAKDPDDPGGVRAMRRLLKTILRAHGIRCCRIEAVTDVDAADADKAEAEGREASI